MTNAKPYFVSLGDGVGAGWNRFWFTPRDAATVSVMRLCGGVVLLWLWLSYWPDLLTFFGPNGLVSREVSWDLRGNVALFSVFDYTQSAGALVTMFWIGATLIAMFAAGLFTRVTCWLALVMYLSIIHRGPVLARPVDDIAAFVLFYLCLAPCGDYFSVDALLRRRKLGNASALAPRSNVDTSSLRPTSWLATISTRLIQLQITAVSVEMALSMLKAPAWWLGTAMWGLIAKPESRLINLTFLASDRWTYVVNLGTLAIVGYFAFFPVLVWPRLTRPLMLMISVPMFLFLALLTGQMSWAAMMLVAILSFVPPETVRGWFARRAVSETKAPVTSFGAADGTRSVPAT